MLCMAAGFGALSVFRFPFSVFRFPFSVDSIGGVGAGLALPASLVM
jgi:hypothetical protein